MPGLNARRQALHRRHKRARQFDRSVDTYFGTESPQFEELPVFPNGTALVHKDPVMPGLTLGLLLRYDPP